MCGRYAYVLPPEAMLALFKVLNELIYPPRFNIKPTEPIVAVWERGGRRTAQMARWGFVPPWAKDPKAQKLLINARAEGIADAPTFRDALRRQRCIVPASGYFEWMNDEDGNRQPYYITNADDSPMALAGIYSTWRGRDGSEVDTAAIVTVSASDELAGVHDRMPAILRGDAVDAWLDTERVGPELARELALPSPPGTMRFYPVSKEVGKVAADGPELLRPLTEAEVEAEQAPKTRKKAASGQLDLF